MRIGQVASANEDFEIENTISKKILTVKEGDKGFIDSKGNFHVTTGAGRGKIFKLNDAEVKGYDHANISKMIYNRLNAVFGLEMYLDDEEIELDEFLEEIEDMLTDIL